MKHLKRFNESNSLENMPLLVRKNIPLIVNQSKINDLSLEELISAIRQEWNKSEMPKEKPTFRTEKLNESNSDNSIPTAEEFLNKEYYHILLDSKDTFIDVDDIKTAMIEFAKLHVQKALESAAESVSMKPEGKLGLYPDSPDDYVIDKDSILDAYPLDNIK